MYFKKYWRSFRHFIIGLLFLTIAMSGCDWGSNLRVGEEDEREDRINYNTANYECMWNVGNKVRSYAAGELSSAEIKEFLSCVQTALKRFAYVTKPLQGYYQPQKVAEFLNDKFLQDEEHISPELVQEIMAFKVVLLGGDENRFTVQEYDGLIEFVSLVEKIAIRNRDLMPVYQISRENSDQFDVAQIESAKRELRSVAHDLAVELGRSGVAYSMDSLRRFLEQWDRLFKSSQSLPDDWTIGDLVDLLDAVKGIATSGPPAAILSQEWAPLLDTLAGIHGLYMDSQKYFHKDHVLMNNLDAIVSMVTSGLALLENAITISPNGYIPYDKIDRFVDVLSRKELLRVTLDHGPPLELRAQSVKEAYRHLFGIALQNPASGSNRTPSFGLNLEALNELRSEFSLWLNAQRFLTIAADQWTDTYRAAQRSLTASLFNLVKYFDFSEYLKRPGGPRMRSEEMEFIIRYIRPLFAPDDNRVFIVPKLELEPMGIRHNWQNLTRMNIIRSLVRMLIRGFASKDRILTMQGVTIDEMEQFYNTTKSLGVDLKFMDARKSGVGRRSFNEGNLFTFNGDGVLATDPNPSVIERREILSYTETMELLSLMWSAGQVRNRFYYRMIDVCGKRHGPAERDNVGDPKIQRQCFYAEFARHQLREIDNLPLMRNYLLSQSVENRNNIIANLESVADVCNDKEWIENAELATMTTILHYAEVVFSIYDTDRSNVLEAHELMRAFGRFHGYLGAAVERIRGPVDIGFLKGIYMFLLEYRRLPTRSDGMLLTFYRYRYFDDNNPYQYGRFNGDAPMSYAFELERPEVEEPEEMPAAPDVSIDRGDLIDVLRILNEQSTSTNTICTPE